MSLERFVPVVTHTEMKMFEFSVTFLTDKWQPLFQMSFVKTFVKPPYGHVM